jgi:hypothetical protein
MVRPAFLIDGQSLQEGRAISHSSGWLGIAPSVRRLVVGVSKKNATPRPSACQADLEETGRTVFLRDIRPPGWFEAIPFISHCFNDRIHLLL